MVLPSFSKAKLQVTFPEKLSQSNFIWQALLFRGWSPSEPSLLGSTGVLGIQLWPLSVTLAHSLILVAAEAVLVSFWLNPCFKVCIRSRKPAGTLAWVTEYFNFQRWKFSSRSLYWEAKGWSPSLPPGTFWLLWKVVSGHGSSARASWRLLLLSTGSQGSAVGSHMWHQGTA